MVLDRELKCTKRFLPWFEHSTAVIGSAKAARLRFKKSCWTIRAQYSGFGVGFSCRWSFGSRGQLCRG